MTDSVTVGLTLFMLATLAVGGVGLLAWASIGKKRRKGRTAVNEDEYSYNINKPVVTIPPKRLVGIALVGLLGWVPIFVLIWYWVR